MVHWDVLQTDSAVFVECSVSREEDTYATNLPAVALALVPISPPQAPVCDRGRHYFACLAHLYLWRDRPGQRTGYGSAHAGQRSDADGHAHFTCPCANKHSGDTVADHHSYASVQSDHYADSNLDRHTFTHAIRQRDRTSYVNRNAMSMRGVASPLY